MYQGLWMRGYRKAELPLEVSSSAIMWQSTSEESGPVAIAGDAERVTSAAAAEEEEKPAAKVFRLAQPNESAGAELPPSAPRLSLTEDEMLLSILIGELQRRLQDPSCKVKAIMLTPTSSSIEYKEAGQ